MVSGPLDWDLIWHAGVYIPRLGSGGEARRGRKSPALSLQRTWDVLNAKWGRGGAIVSYSRVPELRGSSRPSRRGGRVKPESEGPSRRRL